MTNTIAGLLEPGYRISVLEPNQQVQSQAATVWASGKESPMLFDPRVFSRISSCPFNRSIAQMAELWNQKLKINMFRFTFVSWNITECKKNHSSWPSQAFGDGRGCVSPCRGCGRERWPAREEDVPHTELLQHSAWFLKPAQLGIWAPAV